MTVDISFLIEESPKPIEEYTIAQYFGDRVFPLMPRAFWKCSQDLRLGGALMAYADKVQALLEDSDIAEEVVDSRAGFYELLAEHGKQNYILGVEILFYRYLRRSVEASLDLPIGTLEVEESSLRDRIIYNLYADIHRKLSASIEESTVTEGNENPSGSQLRVA